MSTADLTTPVEYREIPDRPGYRFGSDGTAWNHPVRDLWGRTNWSPMRGHVRPDGSVQILMKVAGKNKLFRLHELIAEAFHGPRPAPGMRCKRRDGDPCNNRPDNLYWSERAEDVSGRTSKPCCKCKVVKPLEDFTVRSQTRDGRHTRCKSCESDDSRGYASTPVGKAKKAAAEVRSKLKHRYRITRDEFDRLHAEQGGVCAICGRTPNGVGRNQKRLHVDHDHATGEVRGLLCNRCNISLAGFGDTLEGVMRAVEYLRRTLST